MAKKYWLGPGILSNPKGKPVQPDEEISKALLKSMGVDRVKQLEKQAKIADQPKSAAYVIATRNTQAALIKSVKETAEAKKENEKLVGEITKLKIENETLKAENKILKNAEKDRDKATKELEKVQTALETLKKGYSTLNDQLKEAKWDMQEALALLLLGKDLSVRLKLNQGIEKLEKGEG